MLVSRMKVKVSTSVVQVFYYVSRLRLSYPKAVVGSGSGIGIGIAIKQLAGIVVELGIVR